MYNLLNFFMGLIDSYSANFLSQNVAYLCTAVVYWWGYTPLHYEYPPGT